MKRGAWSTIVIALFLVDAIRAANLTGEAAKAWEDYIEGKNALTTSRGDGSFLLGDIDKDRGAWAELRSGKILVFPAGPKIPKRVPSGLIHDWVGTAFIPDATIPQVLAAVRDYDRYKDHYHPGVVDSKLESTSEDQDRFTMVLMNKSFFLKTALEGDYRASYFRVDDHRAYSIAESTRIQEIEGYGDAGARPLPEGEGAGLMWRVDTITRYEECEGGVLIQLEAMVLSRDVPSALHWMVYPIIRRVSKESIELSLVQTRRAVQSNLAHTESLVSVEKAVLTNEKQNAR